MDYINKHDLKPGPYQHYKGNIYVVTEIIDKLHAFGDKAMMDNLDKLGPIVVYRRLDTGEVFAQPLSRFKETKPDGEEPDGHGNTIEVEVPRFKAI